MYRCLGLCCVLLLLSGCSSLSGRVKDYSVDYSVTMEQFSNEQVLVNILRAQHQQPLHFAELGQINGSLQSSGQVGAAIPFGKYVSEAKNANTVSSQITFASSPTFNTSPLDTQAFTVALLQPIDATYFARHWRTADAQMKRLLLYVFVDSVENADADKLIGKYTIFNDPYPTHPRGSEDPQTGDSAGQSFEAFVNTWTMDQVDFRLVTVESPLGGAFCIGPKQVKMSDVVAFSKEPSIHVTKSDEKSACGKDQAYQLQHVAENQPALCAPTDKVKAMIAAQHPGTKAESVPSHLSWFLALKIPGANSPHPPVPSSGGPSAPVSLPPSPIVSLAGLFPIGQCDQGSIPPDGKETAAAKKLAGEDGSDKDKPEALRIRLRSPSEVFYYLGQVLGSTTEEKQLVPKFQRFPAIDLTIGSGDMTKDGDPPAPEDGAGASNDSPRIAVTYNNVNYWIDEGKQSPNYTLKLIAMLSELVNSSKLSSDIPTIKQVQVIP